MRWAVKSVVCWSRSELQNSQTNGIVINTKCITITTLTDPYVLQAEVFNTQNHNPVLHNLNTQHNDCLCIQ